MHINLPETKFKAQKSLDSQVPLQQKKFNSTSPAGAINKGGKGKQNQLQNQPSMRTRFINLKDWTKEMFKSERAMNSQQTDQIINLIQQKTQDLKEMFNRKLKEQMKELKDLKEDHVMNTQILEKHMKTDPLPPARVATIKQEIKEELEAELPRGRSKRKGLTSDSSKLVDSEDDLDAMDTENTTIKDLVIQINQMNEILPKRFEKFQTALDEKLKVNDAKIKRIVKDSADKTSRSIKQNVDATDKLKKGLVTFQTMIN